MTTTLTTILADEIRQAVQAGRLDDADQLSLVAQRLGCTLLPSLPLTVTPDPSAWRCPRCSDRTPTEDEIQRHVDHCLPSPERSVERGREDYEADRRADA